MVLSVDNGAVSEIDRWTDGTHVIESGKRIIANNLINSLKYFLELMNQSADILKQKHLLVRKN